MMVYDAFSSINFTRHPQLSIIIPACNEEGNLRKLYRELVQVLSSLAMSWEIIIIDDGSTDRTWEEIKSIRKQDDSVRGIRLSRNFGHQYALFAGLSYASGEAVVSMDADFQHPPEIIPKLIENWQNGSKIVHTVRTDPDDYTFFKKVSSRLYYKVFSFLTGVPVESGMADFRLLDRQVVDAVLQFREQGLFLRGLVHWAGYASSIVEFQAQNRFSGVSKYTLRKMVKFAFYGITSFSIVPLRISILIGILTALLAFGELFYVFYVRLFLDQAVPGWASVVGILTLLFGVLFIMLGLVGEYIGQILIEVRDRPRFLVTELIGLRSLPRIVKSRPLDMEIGNHRAE